jgi:proteasome lid subunit RPN8/RPN11
VTGALHIPLSVVREMLEQARREAPNECLGLLFGRGDYVERRLPLKNAAASPQAHYFADPDDLLAALKEADVRGEKLVAIYHSHPLGPATPSQVDLQEAHYRVAALIIAPHSNVLRAFDLTAEGYLERDIIVWGVVGRGGVKMLS